MEKVQINTVWYYSRNHCQWFTAELVPAYLGGTASTLEELRDQVRMAGYPAVLGNFAAGPPTEVPEK